MMEWWNNLGPLTQGFYCAAAFFGVLFLWQLISAFIGLSGEEAGAEADADVGAVEADVGDVEAGGVELEADATYEDFEHGAETDAAETTEAFRILSIRSIITFFTLFTWAGALYLDRKVVIPMAMLYAIAWGLAGMILIALVFHWMRKLTETGNLELNTCVGRQAIVYLDIQEGMLGEIRVNVSGVETHVKARTADSSELKAGVPVTVTRVLDQSTVEVRPDEQDEQN